MITDQRKLIKSLEKKFGTIYKVAQNIGIHRTQLYRWKENEVRMSLETCVKLNNFLKGN